MKCLNCFALYSKERKCYKEPINDASHVKPAYTRSHSVAKHFVTMH